MNNTALLVVSNGKGRYQVPAVDGRWVSARVMWRRLADRINYAAGEKAVSAALLEGGASKTIVANGSGWWVA